MKPKVTHYCFFDLEIDGKQAGRLDFELFGEQAPKTVNNFLALCSGEMNRNFLWYKGSLIHKVHSGRWIMGGDIVNGDGTGSTTVYGNGQQKTIEAEVNDLKFSEPYLLVASANDKGHTGSQFIITLDELPSLDYSKNTIFGRLLKGTRTIHQIEGRDELRQLQRDNEKIKDRISQESTPEKFGLFRKKRTYESLTDSKIVISNSGVYKLGQTT